MIGAELHQQWEALKTNTRRAAFAWTIYGRPEAMPDGWHYMVWAAFAEFRAAVTGSTIAEVNAFLALTGSKQRLAA